MYLCLSLLWLLAYQVLRMLICLACCEIEARKGLETNKQLSVIEI
ncbi:hypothetical protein HanXRQr2_Chr05g0215641 [Helianthus annuus]|uniref:Uncharacterized protein n=1 Tax=Helianthus annuus TaxID=4232 RepID=A0A9K3J070_HELAN|nr:hypothetical protein HanXRQr2_Chr05g0215641 [Helianthus annuus]KAJ0922816.1 hypothetical protein HanPSC8_Chr05g0208191 [Helianthus annuus]